MAPLIDAERWCQQVVARSLVTQRVVDCHRPAVSIALLAATACVKTTRSSATNAG